MRRLNIGHVTGYLFSHPMSLLPRLRLRPRENRNLHIESSVPEMFAAHTRQCRRGASDNSVAVGDFSEHGERRRLPSVMIEIRQHGTWTRYI